MRYFFDLSLENKALIISSIIIIFLIAKNIILKKRLNAIKLKLNILEQQKKKYGSETELDKLTKEFLELSKADKEDDFGDWLDNAEIGEVYHFKNDEK